jgi:hypothetical protein
MTYQLRVNGEIVETFETAQDAMDYGSAYHSDGYTVLAK